LILTLLGSFIPEKTGNGSPEIFEQTIDPPKANSRALHILFVHFIKYCEGLYFNLFLAAALIEFTVSIQIDVFLDLDEAKTVLQNLVTHRLQNILCFYFSMKELISANDLRKVQPQERAREFLKDTKGLFTGELALLSGVGSLGFENGFLLDHFDTEGYLDQMASGFIRFFESKNFVNGEFELANLCIFLLKNVY
jgi:hypothetical protein